MRTYIVDLTHLLDEKGVIAATHGPARKLALFVTSVIAHATDVDCPNDVPGPACFRCRKRDDRRVETGITADACVVWYCAACDTEGLISKWEDSFWDLLDGKVAQ